MDTDTSDMRNEILAGIIDKMHERMASKMYPDDSHGDEEAAVMPKDAPKAEMAAEEPEDEELMNELMSQEIE